MKETKPVKPEVDPLFLSIKQALDADNRTTNAKANVSGLSASTLKNWQNGKVKRPQSISLQMAARMLRYEIVLRKMK